MDSIPYIPLYPGDLQRHIGFRMASHATVGVYLRLLLLMGSSERRGALVHGDAVLSKADAAALVGGDLKATMQAIEELLRLRLLQIGQDGALESPELIKSEQERTQNAARQREFKERKRRERERAGNGRGNALVTEEVTETETDLSLSESGPSNVPVICMSSSSSSSIASSSSSPTEIHACAREENPGVLAEETAETVFEELIGRKMTIYQAEKSGIVIDLRIWRATLQDWLLNGYSPRNFSGMLEAYKANVTKPQLLNGHNGKSGLMVGSSQPSVRLAEVVDLPPRPKRERSGQWGEILNHLEASIGADHVRTWFEPLDFLWHEDVGLCLRAPDLFFSQFIESNYSAQFRDAIVTVFGDECAVHFQLKSHTAEV